MALSLGVRGGKKVRFIVKGKSHIMTVLEVVSPSNVRVAFDGREILITDLERAKLMDNVFVSCGKEEDSIKEGYTRLAFEAPREIRIERIP
jgi:hypothetical protein